MPDRQCNMDTTIGVSSQNFSNLINSSCNWSLASDVELLKCLEKFSQNLICHASLTLSSMDNLEDSLNETLLRVRTVANEFQAIADHQFIENRVQEEEEDFVLANDKKEDLELENSTETNKARLLESIKACQNALSKKFNAVQVNTEHSEDAISNTSPVLLVPRGVSSTRQLPQLVAEKAILPEEGLDYCLTEDLNGDSADSDVDETDRSQPLLLAYDRRRSESATSRIFEEETMAKGPPPMPVLSSKTSHDDDDSEASNLPSSIFVDAAKTSITSLDSASNTSIQSGSDSTEEKKELNKTNEISDIKPVSAVSRDHLLAGPNIASFKEDLARVLSSKKPLKKQSSSESDTSKDETLDTPIEKSPHTISRTLPTVPKPVSPDLLPAPSTNQIQIPTENLDSVTLPNIASDVLESLSKTRVKVRSNRRPPSRKHRRSVIEGESGGSLTEDMAPSGSESTRNGDTSNPESSSTQPGSNVLSPVTDEEDLFVMPAFDLPTDPPARGLFLGDSLLSPGTSIDDGVSPVTPVPNPSLVPTPKLNVSNSEVPQPTKSTSKVGMSRDSGENREENATSEPYTSKDSPANLFSNSSSTGSVSGVPEDIFAVSATLTTVKRKTNQDIFENHDEPSEKVDLFADASTIRRTMTKKYDLFSSEDDNEFSSSPPLFSDWQIPPKDKASPIISSHAWDPLESDDLSEDLFRSASKHSTSIVNSKPEKQAEQSVIPSFENTAKKEYNVFSSAMGFSKSDSAKLFEDDTVDSSNIFSGSSSFMGLSLPKRNRKESLFTSDDEDDDVLFKSTTKPSNQSSTVAPKTQDILKFKRSSEKVKVSSQAALHDPLMSVAEQE